MATITSIPRPLHDPITRTPTLADIQAKLQVPAERILASPSPGTATVDDVVAIHDRENRLCELVDGILVEKAMGIPEATLATVLSYILKVFLAQNPLGIVVGADGMLRLAPGLVRIPDVAFISRDQFPPGRIKTVAIPPLVPTLAVEVLSQGNSRTEMERKLQEYFTAGSKQVWFLDPIARTVSVDTTADQFAELDESQTLDVGVVLTGFRLSIRDWFEQAENPFGEP